MTKSIRLLLLIPTIGLALTACNLGSRNSEQGTTTDQVSYSHVETAQDQVDLFDLQVARLQEQLGLGDVAAKTLSIQSDWSDSLRDIPPSAVKQWEETVDEILATLPELETAEFTWLAEASQLVAVDEIDAVTEDLIGFFVISAHFQKGFEEGFSDWAVMFTVNLDTWEILDVKVNEDIEPGDWGDWDYTPGGLLCNRGEGCTHYRRVLPSGLSTTSVDEDAFPVAVAKEDGGFSIYSE